MSVLGNQDDLLIEAVEKDYELALGNGWLTLISGEAGLSLLIYWQTRL